MLYYKKKQRKGDFSMKSWVKIALSNLLLIWIISTMILIYSIEEMPMGLQVICWITVGCLALALPWMMWSLAQGKKKRREEDLMRRVRQTLESPKFSDTPDPNSILYLRPFDVDEEYMSEVEYAGRRFNSFEGLICQMVTEAGSPIAIGRPGEDLQPLGARRIYASDDTWQAKVAQYFAISKCVILYADFTPGVKWEIDNAMRFHRHKLVLIPKIYNRYGSAAQKVAQNDPTMLTYPAFSLWVNRFLFKKAHRGRAYYREWNKLLKPYMPGFKMDDTVSAIIFEYGRAIPFYARRPNQEEQFQAIHRAINTRLGKKPRPELFLYKNTQPMFSLCADLSMFHYNYADLNMKSLFLYPGAMGRLEFFDRGLRYNPFYGRFFYQRTTNAQGSQLKYNKKDQLIPYTAIRQVIPMNDHCLQLVLEETNGSMLLSLSPGHGKHLPAIRWLLEQCIRTGHYCHDSSGTLDRVAKDQADDHAKAFYLMEGLSMGIFAAVFLLSMTGNPSANVFILAMGWMWHFATAIFAYSLSWVSGRKVTQIIGILAAALHLCLAFFFGSLI